MKKTTLLSFLLTVFFTQVFADDYATRAKTVRDSVWSWKMPMFENRTVPTEYSNESAVVIAHYEEINASGKSKLRFMSVIGVNKELYYTSITRKMVKINDKSALDEFSEFSFKETTTRYGHNSMNTLNSYLGARIIKPDGTIKEVNVNEAVEVNQDKNGKDNYKKLAIPDLQVGDILDYFIQEDYKLDNTNVPQSLFVFAGRYPILNYKVHCEINKNLVVEYKSINGAPQFSQTVNDEITYLDVEKTNIPKIEMIYWTAPFRQYPIIRMNVLNNAQNAIYKPSSARTKGIYANLDANYILTDAYNSMGDFSKYYSLSASSKTKKHIKNFKSKYPNATKEELADYIYNVTKIDWMSNLSSTHQYFFMLKLYDVFTKNKIPCTIGFVTHNNGARLNELMDIDDLIPIVSTGNGRFYTYPNLLSYAGKGKYDIEGETAVTQSFFSTRNILVKVQDISLAKREIIPQTDFQQNKSKYEFEVGFEDVNSPDLTMKLTQEHSGFMKQSSQATILNFYDVDSELRKQMEINTDFITDYSGSQKDKNEITTMIEDFKKGQKDSVKSDLYDFHRIKIKDVQNYSILNYGISKKDSAFKYEAVYTVEGLMKRAGNNFVFSLGKLIGDQLKIDDEDRNRTIDVYMSYARSLEYEININIPEGYKIESADNFKVNIANEYASFTSEPTFEGNKLILRVKKSYIKSFIPISDWEKILSIVDAANVLFGQSVIIKKI